MDELYNDILNSLENKKSIEYDKIRQNREIEKATILAKELLKTVYIEQALVLEHTTRNEYQTLPKELEKIKHAKTTIINKLKEEINAISNNHHQYRLNGIINGKEINKNNLDFALELLYHNKEAYSEIEEIRKYAKQHNNINNAKKIIEDINKSNNQIINMLGTIIEKLDIENKPKKINIIKYIKWKKENNKKAKTIDEYIEKIKKEIEKVEKLNRNEVIREYGIDTLENIEKTYEQIKNSTKKNITKNICIYMKNQLEQGFKKTEKKIKTTFETKNKELINIRLNRTIHQQIINKIMYSDNDYIRYMTQSVFSKEKNQKETLFARILLIIKLIDLVENNEIDIYDMQNKEEEVKKEK